MFVRSLNLSQFFVSAALFTMGSLAHADVKVVTSCSLSGTVEYSEDIFLQCGKTLKIAPGTQISVSKDHTLTISVYEGIEYGSGSAIDAAGSTLDIDVEGTAMGVLNVNGGNVKLEYGSTYEYDHNLNLGETDTHEMVIHRKQVALAGPMLKPITE